MKRIMITLSAMALLSTPVSAANLQGVWATEPDAKSQTGHVRITPCGGAMCGTLVRTFDKTGAEITTRNVGKMILRNIRQTGANTYGDGKVFVPIMGAEFPVNLTVTGNRLRLKACNALGICRTQNWSRVK